ncbi:MAG TPA: B12-binding domain-containing radical SAM protein, partial [Spirochaeta sp.]|nr:B12-binding domain-containing radical SAM protein [Spirochaeta sp.]
NPATIELLGPVRRKPDGTGKFHRSQLKLPSELNGIQRRFARYGIHPEAFAEQIARNRPDAVFIASGMTYWYRGLIEAIEVCRSIWPDVPVIMGGVYASLMSGHCKSVCGPDYIAAGSMITGSGEALSESGLGLNEFLSRASLPGIALAAGSGPLDASCWTDAAVLRLNDGCPMNCGYCASRSLCGGFTKGRPELAFNRLRHLSETRGTRNFAFYDDALLFDSDRSFIPFLRQVIDYSRSTGVNFNFYTPNAMHIRYMTIETAELMKMAGFQEVRLGFESSSPEFHCEYDNKYSEPGFHNTVKMLSEAGFSREQIIVYILAGLPGQQASEVEDTIRFASGRGLSLSVSEFSPVPGSPMWPDCVENCRFPIEDEPLFHNNSFFPMEWKDFSREDMQRLKTLSKQHL